MLILCLSHAIFGWQRGAALRVVGHQRSYSTSNPVSIVTGDRLLADKPLAKVNSALHRSGVAKSSTGVAEVKEGCNLCLVADDTG